MAQRVRIMKVNSLIEEASKRLDGLKVLLAEEHSHLKWLVKKIADLENFRCVGAQILKRFPLLLFYMLNVGK